MFVVISVPAALEWCWLTKTRRFFMPIPCGELRPQGKQVPAIPPSSTPLACYASRFPAPRNIHSLTHSRLRPSTPFTPSPPPPPPPLSSLPLSSSSFHKSNRKLSTLSKMNELDNLRQEAETLKNTIRVRDFFIHYSSLSLFTFFYFSLSLSIYLSLPLPLYPSIFTFYLPHLMLFINFNLLLF